MLVKMFTKCFAAFGECQKVFGLDWICFRSIRTDDDDGGGDDDDDEDEDEDEDGGGGDGDGYGD